MSKKEDEHFTSTEQKNNLIFNLEKEEKSVIKQRELTDNMVGLQRRVEHKTDTRSNRQKDESAGQLQRRRWRV